LNKDFRIVFPTPDGKQFNQEKAIELSENENIIFICGHYKGIDERIRQQLITDEISIGDYIVTGGELPAMIILDSVVRLIPGVLNTYESAATDSFMSDLLDHPHYTRPEEYRSLKVPQILLSGNHGKIDEWKIQKREEKTKNIRQDLWEKYLKKES
jgi:tRNA (guanine37-N1)-methyltransferase